MKLNAGLGLAGVLLLAGCMGLQSSERTVYVSSKGNDAGTGMTSKAPFATLEQARDAIREARKAGSKGEWRVLVAPGRYERTAPFELTEEDSDTTYRGIPGKTILTGGSLVLNWKDEGQGVWSAEIDGLKDGKVYFEQLFVDNERAVRARWPKTQRDWKFGEDRKDFLRPLVVKEIVTTNEQKVVSVDQYIVAHPGELDLFKGVPAEELNYCAMVIHHNWDTTRRMILGYETNTLAMRGGGMKRWNPWRTNSLYYVENVRTAFTDPGEWFLAKNEGKLYYRPLKGQDVTKVVVEYPCNGMVQLMVIKGGRNINFNGLQFSVSDTPRRDSEMNQGNLKALVPDNRSPGPTQVEPRQAANNTEAVILADNLTDSSFLNCRVSNVGEYGFWLRGGCFSNTVEHCEFIDTGAGGVRLGTGFGGPKSGFNAIRNCRIVRGGRFHAAATGVWMGDTANNTVTHNLIADHYYTGISLGWHWGYKGTSFDNDISFNLIEDIGQATLGDMGGIYTLGTLTGTRLSNNLIRNVDSYTYGGWGIYPDEGSEGLVIENNLVYNVKDGCFHQHYGKENMVRNNIFAFSRKDQVAVSRPEAHLSCSFLNNIIYWSGTNDVIISRYRTEKAKVVWDKNIYWCENGQPEFRGMTLKQWQAISNDVNSIAADPLFVNPGKRDFRFRSDRVCRKTGFVPFDYSKAGPED